MSGEKAVRNSADPEKKVSGGDEERERSEGEEAGAGGAGGGKPRKPLLEFFVEIPRAEEVDADDDPIPPPRVRWFLRRLLGEVRSHRRELPPPVREALDDYACSVTEWIYYDGELEEEEEEEKEEKEEKETSREKKGTMKCDYT